MSTAVEGERRKGRSEERESERDERARKREKERRGTRRTLDMVETSERE
jgi:hypothetical protein